MINVTGFLIGTSSPGITLLGILGFTVLVSVIQQFVFKKFSDQTMIKSLNSEIKEIRSKIKSSEVSPDKKLELNSKLLSLSNKKMMYVMKPFLYVAPLFLILFPLMRTQFSGFQLLVFSSSLPLIGKDIGWLLTYILMSLPINSAIKKGFGVET